MNFYDKYAFLFSLPHAQDFVQHEWKKETVTAQMGYEYLCTVHMRVLGLPLCLAI